MKKMIFPVIMFSLAFLLSGCVWQKGNKKNVKSKKMVQAAGNGVPLARFEKGNKRFWDDRVEAFVLEEDDTDREYGTTVAHAQTSKPFSEDLNAAEKAWNLEADSTREFETVYFNFDDYSVRKDQDAVVAYDTEQAKEAVKAGKLVRVEGHSDKQCISETYNMAVSQKRAQTVANRLEKAGVERSSLKAIGYGDSKPAVDVSGREQRNRRVEFTTLAA